MREIFNFAGGFARGLAMLHLCPSRGRSCDIFPVFFVHKSVAKAIQVQYSNERKSCVISYNFLGEYGCACAVGVCSSHHA